MIFITPLGIAESNYLDDAVDEIFRVLEKILKLNYFFTDQSYNNVIYPKERIFCRTLINQLFFSLKEISNKKLLGYKCFRLGDTTFRKDILERITKEKEKSRLIELIGERSYQKFT